MSRSELAGLKTYQRQLDLGAAAIYALLQQRFHPIQTRQLSHEDADFAEDLADLLLIFAAHDNSLSPVA